MLKRRRLFLLIAFTFMCSWLGFRAASLAQGRENHALLSGNFLPGVPPTGIASLELKTLLLEVDSLADPDRTHLNSAWLVVNNPTLSGVYWFPLYPPASFKEKRNQLSRDFRLGLNRLPANDFLAEVQSIYKIEWDSLLILDRNDLMDIVSTLNGMQVDEQKAMEDQTLPFEDPQYPQNALANYVKYIRTLCQRRNEMVSYPAILGPLAERIAGRLQPASTTEPAYFNQIVSRFKELLVQQQPLPCEFVGVK